ncbi:hypothetical protein K435DRAFT_396334 [Dendrothele bispora CBS 962.96]|uniref:Uncharacterized protein n=1 Tax=Dendrothele bispora (strain CBS 962.96) TaxID=1314807 RepID=A0A4S8MH94_DENBC|nr:hypothetical protein K435DRAFT_396334 [Dendrothele bispora CBS 962.96]
MYGCISVLYSFPTRLKPTPLGRIPRPTLISLSPLSIPPSPRSLYSPIISSSAIHLSASSAAIHPLPALVIALSIPLILYISSRKHASHGSLSRSRYSDDIYPSGLVWSWVRKDRCCGFVT